MNHEISLPKTTKLEIKKMRKKLNSMKRLKMLLESAQTIIKLVKEKEEVKKEILYQEYELTNRSKHISVKFENDNITECGKAYNTKKI